MPQIQPFLAVLTLALSFTVCATSYAQSEKLQDLHQWVEQTFPAVDHIDSEEFLDPEILSGETVVFDVRDPEEFAVSHLQGAIQVDPEISEQEFIERFGNSLKDKNVVFYCSVGRRSSLLADKVSDSLVEAGSSDIFNLKHGIFGWHDEKKPLMGPAGATDYVHPFSWRWKRYLKHKDLARYKTE